MSTSSVSKPEIRPAPAAVTCMLGLLLLAGPVSLLAQYQGAEYCYDCHDQEHYQWLTSGC